MSRWPEKHRSTALLRCEVLHMAPPEQEHAVSALSNMERPQRLRRRHSQQLLNLASEPFWSSALLVLDNGRLCCAIVSTYTQCSQNRHLRARPPKHTLQCHLLGLAAPHLRMLSAWECCACTDQCATVKPCQVLTQEVAPEAKATTTIGRDMPLGCC